jgi:charged multivesicular body protein 7
VIEHQHSRPRLSFVDMLHNPESFRTEFGKIAIPGNVLSEKDVNVLIKYLQRDKGVLVTEREVGAFFYCTVD